MQFHYKIQRQFLRLIARCYFRVSFVGTEHIPPSGPVILASNHCSYLDPPMVGMGLSRQIAFLAKEELFKVPILGWWLRWVGVHPVARGQGDMKALRLALRLLKENKALLVFPEGTRSPEGTVQPFETGSAWLAIHSGAAVVPVYINGTYQAFPRGRWFPKPCRVTLYYGEPIHPPAKDNQAGRNQIEAFTNRLQAVVQEMACSYTQGQPSQEQSSLPSKDSHNLLDSSRRQAGKS